MQKLLLTSVFGPYAVDDEFGRKENKMELFDNQITREQGIFSYRFNHASFGLYFLAENLDLPVTVLDFPSEKRFIREIQTGEYTHIGISFIVPNFKKALHMAKLIRIHAPDAKIILGGHGTAIKGIDKMIPNDYVCKGEGVGFLRKLFNEPPLKSYSHPLVYSAFNRHVMGVPLPKEAGVLIPGVGCPNRCSFCATAHYFGDYIPFLKTGKDVYDICCRYEKEWGVTDFGVLDENFLKQEKRTEELLELLEQNNKHFSFSIFSSAETLVKLENLDVLSRLGVSVIWIGVESKKETYAKNKGIDFKELFSELQKRGISVLASTILFLEHHDKDTIWEDLDYAMNLRPEYLQFMELGPMPGTPLYRNYERKGLILKELPQEENHGQGKIWFRHPHFTREESEEFLKRAFNKDYELNGASFLRMMETVLKGYEYLKNHDNPRLREKAPLQREFLLSMRYFLPSASFFAKNEATKKLIRKVRKEFYRLLGKPGLKNYFMSFTVLGFSMVTSLKIKLNMNTLQPECIRKEYPLRHRKNTALISEKASEILPPVIKSRPERKII